MDRYDNYQYKAFGVPGLGLKRGLGDDLVVAPYATALAAMLDPAGGRPEPAAPGRGRARGRVRLLRGHRLHARDARRDPGLREKDEPSGNRRAGVHGPSPGDDSRVSRQRPARRSDGEALPCRPARAGHRAAAAGAGPAPGPHHPAAAGRGDARGRPGARPRHSPLPVAAHALPSCAVPVERQLHRRRHERGRRRQLLPRPRGHALPRGSDPRSGEPVPLPARRPERRGLVGPPSSPP